MVVQDGDNKPAQNFKLVRWDRVKEALRLDR
jgi:myo-inositol-hexaphosphate 3-phosphohydrolase